MTDFDSIAPKVPAPISSQANPIEKYLLDCASVQEQQNEIIWSTLCAVKEQTTRTNGRVTLLEAKAEEAEKVVNTFKKARAWAIGACSVIAPAVYAVIERLLNPSK